MVLVLLKMRPFPSNNRGHIWSKERKLQYKRHTIFEAETEAGRDLFLCLQDVLIS